MVRGNISHLFSISGLFLLFIFENVFSQNKNHEFLHEKPNLIIILADDMGYADIGIYGAKNFSTPNLDKMAHEGIRFTNFYTSASICSPSRASLLTGCYAQRVGIPGVISNNDKHGIHPDEKLLSEILKEQNYATAIFGKWHLGHNNSIFLPLQNGFDEFLGTLGSNDMGNVMSTHARKLGFCGLQLYEGNSLISINPDQRMLTSWYTEAAVDFIKRKKDQPFFLYLAYNMPHTPLAVSDKNKGKSQKGLYGDVIQEIDWSVGKIQEALKTYGIDENTWVVFTSDNGPWLIFGEHGGSAQPLRGGKKQVLEGGMKVPCIMRFPGMIPAGEVREQMVTIMDILPTMTNLAEGVLPNVKIDGKNIWSIIKDDALPANNIFYYYYMNELRALQSGKWKIYFPHVDANTPDFEHIGILGYRGLVKSEKIEKSLYNLELDVSETNNVIEHYPDIVQKLDSLAKIAKKDLGDNLTKSKGNNVRLPLIIN